MTQTQAPAENVPETAVQARNAYLPVPPDGWEYKIELLGPRGARVDVAMTVWSHLPTDDRMPDNVERNVAVEVTTSTREKRTFYRSALKDAVRAGVEAAKALNVIAEHETRAQEATKALLDTIGGEQETEPEEEPAGSSTDN